MSRRANRSHVVDFTAGYKAGLAYDARRKRQEASERTARRIVCAVVIVITLALIYSLQLEQTP